MFQEGGSGQLPHMMLRGQVREGMKGGSGLAEDTGVAEPDSSAKAQGQGKPSLSGRVEVGGRREGDSGIQRGPFGFEGI